MEGDRWKVVVDPTRLAAAPVRYIKPASVPDAALSDMAALWESSSAKSEEEAAHGLGLLKKSAGGGGGAGLGMMAAGTAVPLHKTSYDRPVAGLPHSLVATCRCLGGRHRCPSTGDWRTAAR